jgi:tetratricopeptide (TPR) repeat protein
MSQEKKHIDIDQINRYLNGEMSALERNALEKEALSNPFLAEALDGLESHPGSLSEFKRKHAKKFKRKRDFTLLIGFSVLALFFVVSYSIKFEGAAVKVDQYKEQSINHFSFVEREYNRTEVEKIPAAIDSLNKIDDHMIIPIDEIQRQQTNDHNATENKPNYDPITIDEPLTHHDDPELVEEDLYQAGQLSLETVYMNDLMVVDYRVIKRADKKIHYTRMELSGTSAAQENENDRDETFVETKVEVPYVNYLKKSMGYFASGEYKKALSRYETILTQYPDDINAHFYGGLSYFNLGQYDKAITYLDDILNDDYHVFDEASMWYKSKALIQLNRIPEAKEILLKIIARGGFYSKDAILLQKKI